MLTFVPLPEILSMFIVPFSELIREEMLDSPIPCLFPSSRIAVSNPFPLSSTTNDISEPVWFRDMSICDGSACFMALFTNSQITRYKIASILLE